MKVTLRKGNTVVTEMTTRGGTVTRQNGYKRGYNRKPKSTLKVSIELNPNYGKEVVNTVQKPTVQYTAPVVDNRIEEATPVKRIISINLNSGKSTITVDGKKEPVVKKKPATKVETKSKVSIIRKDTIQEEPKEVEVHNENDYSVSGSGILNPNLTQMPDRVSFGEPIPLSECVEIKEESRPLVLEHMHPMVGEGEEVVSLSIEEVKEKTQVSIDAEALKAAMLNGSFNDLTTVEDSDANKTQEELDKMYAYYSAIEEEEEEEPIHEEEEVGGLVKNAYKPSKSFLNEF